MFDVARTLVAAAERDPRAMALVDGETRFTYGALLEIVRKVAGGLEGLGLSRGDPLVVVMQNRWEMAVLHWACQLAGLVVTPINWRAKAEEIDYTLRDSGARAIAFEPATAETVAASEAAAEAGVIRIAVEDASGGTVVFTALTDHAPLTGDGRAAAEDVSLMLYTSGTTGRGKGVPRRHRAERAAAVAHVAQNQYATGEVTLGVMPLYHTMGVRSLLAMAVINGCFVCLPRFHPVEALRLIAREKVTNLYLVPTLYHDILHHPAFAEHDITSVRKLGFAGASMTDGLLKDLTAAFRPELFVNHYGSSEIYTFTIHQDAPSKPGSAGKAGINQRIRVVRIGSTDPDALVPDGEEGQVIAALEGDESFEGYWNRPDADAKALHGGWYFTGDIGYRDADGDLFVTGRVDDMIITGGENVLPAEIESLLSLHPAVSEVAVAGLKDERWGQKVTAFITRRAPLTAEQLDTYCRESGLANFKRPRDYVFVEAIPKSPVGKILRRKLAAGDFEPVDDTQANQEATP